MSDTVWQFRTRKFTAICKEREDTFADPMVHSKGLIEAFDDYTFLRMHMEAFIYWGETEIGRASLRDCIYDKVDNDENPYGHDRVYSVDRSYRWRVVRTAIADARESLAELDGDVLGLNLRKNP